MESLLAGQVTCILTFDIMALQICYIRIFDWKRSGKPKKAIMLRQAVFFLILALTPLASAVSLKCFSFCIRMVAKLFILFQTIHKLTVLVDINKMLDSFIY